VPRGGLNYQSSPEPENFYFWREGNMSSSHPGVPRACGERFFASAMILSSEAPRAFECIDDFYRAIFFNQTLPEKFHQTLIKKKLPHLAGKFLIAIG
jgi:hypothetical protein